MPIDLPALINAFTLASLRNDTLLTKAQQGATVPVMMRLLQNGDITGLGNYFNVIQQHIAQTGENPMPETLAAWKPFSDIVGMHNRMGSLGNLTQMEQPGTPGTAATPGTADTFFRPSQAAAPIAAPGPMAPNPVAAPTTEPGPGRPPETVFTPTQRPASVLPGQRLEFPGPKQFLDNYPTAGPAVAVPGPTPLEPGAGLGLVSIQQPTPAPTIREGGWGISAAPVPIAASGPYAVRSPIVNGPAQPPTVAAQMMSRAQPPVTTQAALMSMAQPPQALPPAPVGRADVIDQPGTPGTPAIAGTPATMVARPFTDQYNLMERHLIQYPEDREAMAPMMAHVAELARLESARLAPHVMKLEALGGSEAMVIPQPGGAPPRIFTVGPKGRTEITDQPGPMAEAQQNLVDLRQRMTAATKAGEIAVTGPVQHPLSEYGNAYWDPEAKVFKPVPGSGAIMPMAQVFTVLGRADSDPTYAQDPSNRQTIATAAGIFHRNAELSGNKAQLNWIAQILAKNQNTLMPDLSKYAARGGGPAPVATPEQLAQRNGQDVAYLPNPVDQELYPRILASQATVDRLRTLVGKTMTTDPVTNTLSVATSAWQSPEFQRDLSELRGLLTLSTEGATRTYTGSRAASSLVTALRGATPLPNGRIGFTGTLDEFKGGLDALSTANNAWHVGMIGKPIEWSMEAYRSRGASAPGAVPSGLNLGAKTPLVIPTEAVHP